MSRVRNPQVSFADLEFIRQGVHLEPLLQIISDFITEHAELVGRVRQDLQRGLKIVLSRFQISINLLV